MRRNTRRHYQHACEAEGAAGGIRHIEVSLMNRVERASEKADAVHAGVETVASATARHMASSRAGTPSPVTAEIG